MKTMKLTPKQQMVIELLQNGESLITAAGDAMDKPYAGVTYGKECIQLSLRVFWNLVDKGLVYQGGQRERHCFVISELGKSLKFKKP